MTSRSQLLAEGEEWGGSPAFRILRPRFLRWLLAFVMSGTSLRASENAPAPGVREQLPELDASSQLILVISESWEPGPARLRTFERGPDSWVQVGEEVRASVGKRGVAWGVGLHGSHPASEPVKKEGDGKSPAGVFSIEELFGSKTADEAGITRFPYRQVSASFAGVDDPNSKHYNRIVDSAVVQKDWNSAENMVPPRNLYRLGAVLRHNWLPFPGYGSCIFIHTWKGEDVPTSGCTAMSFEDLERVLRWLDREKSPLFVLLPAAEYEARKAAWKLP